MDTLSRRELFKKYSYGLVNTDDIDELQNIFDYAAGIIVKDADMADKYETTMSARNGNTYIKACYKMDDYNETQREKLKGMYEESNQYYRWLLDEYNIDPLTSRTAEDYDILKSISDTNNNGEALLTEYQEELFLKCYREALHYWNNVTRTKSFKNEEMYRQFSEVYLLFMAIQRYITYRMKSQFDVDTFNKFQCKNYFISNGVDYFDSLPLNYQRRLIKLLNDMQRDKGDDTVFDYIKDVLMVNNLDIYKYVLAKHQPTKDSKGDLVFYKVPYDEELNTDKNEVYSFESITEDDPYWRASKDEVLYQTFNTLDTKYISIEYVVDMIKNGKALSYFMYLLNDSMLKDIEAGDKTSLRFFDKNISSNPIKLYDAMMALYSLFYTYIKNDHFDDKPADKIDQDGDGITTSTGKPLIIDIHGYANYENDLSIKETINDIIYEIDNENNENNTPQSIITWNNDLKDFLTVRFNLRDFYYSDNFSFEAIEDFYNNPSYKKYIGNTVENVKLGSMTIKSEFLELARYINAVGYYNTRQYRSYNQALKEFDLYKNVLNDNLKESLAYVWDLIKNQCLPLSTLNIHANFKKLFKKYIAYLIINGDISSSETVGSFYTMNGFYNDHFDIFYNLMIADQNEINKQNPILTELIDYVNEVWGYENAYFDAFLEQYNTREGFKNFIKFINLVQHSFFTRDELYKYSNLLVFLEIFSSLKKEIYTKNANIDQEITGLTNISSKYSDIKIEEFMQVLNKNEAVRAELEKYIRESNNRKIYNGLRKLWLLKFKSNFNFEIYNEFETFKEYLLTNDDELYNFVTKFGDDFPTDSDRRKEIENRILELCTSIEKFIKSNGGIVYNSTFNVIFSNIKDYAILLIEVFKAYTLDTIYSGNVLDFNDPTNERVKIWDEGPSDDEPFIEDLTFEASPEYLDLQDDIRKDNGDMDVSYNLLVRSLVRNSLNVDSESEEDQDKYDKYLKYIKVEFKFLEAQYNLPYGVTSLTPEEFEAKYGEYFKSGKLGFGKRQYKYVTESYDFYHNNPNIKPKKFDPTIQLSSVELHKVLSDNEIEFIYTHIVTTTEALKNRDPSIVNKINDNRTFIDLTNKKIYCNTNDNKLSSLFGNTRDTYTNLYCFDYTSRNADTDNRKYIAYIALDETDNKYYTYVYDYDNDRFNKRCIIANITDYSGVTPYIETHEIEKETDVEMPIYYDPNVYGAWVYGTYIIHPLPNIFSDYPSDFNVADVSYNNIDQYSDFSIFTYNDDFFYKYFNTSGRNNSDTRREKLFYIRPSRDYNWYIGNPDRIPFNKRIHPSLITIPNENYLNFLNTNNLVNSDNIYMIEYISPEEPDDYTGPFYYLPEEIEEDGEIKYILNKENRKTNIDDLHFVIKGNEVKNIELDLGKEYYCYASYTFSDLYNMYEKIEEDTIQDPENYKMYPMLTMYLKLNHKMTTAEREKINSQLNIVDIELINSSNYLYKVKGNTKGKNNTSSIVDITKMNRILNFFNNVGHSMEDTNNTGFDSNYPFEHIESLLDEAIKHQFFFIKNEEDGLCTLLKYSHEYNNVSPKGFYEIGYGYNFSSGSKIKILFEPLRYYNFSEFRDKLVEADPLLDPSNPDELPYYRDQSILDKESIPYYVDIKDQSTILDPEPYLCKKDKDTDLVSYPVIGDNYLRALHQNYSNYRASSETNNLTGQFIRYDITEDKGQIPGGNDNLTDYFKSIKCDGLADVSVEGVYNFYYYYDKIRGEDLPPQDLNGLSIGGYSYWLDTIDNALDGIKLKTPSTINNNAWLLTFFASIEKPDTSTSLTIEVDDFVNNSNTFGYIAVANKGVTNYNDPTDRPLLSEIARLSNTLNIKTVEGITVNDIASAAEIINDFSKVSRFTTTILDEDDEIVVKSKNHDPKNILYDEDYNYIRMMTFNDGYDSPEEFADNESTKEFYYDYDYITELENNGIMAKETIIDSGIFNKSLSKNLVKTHIIITDIEGNLIFDSLSDDNLNKNINFFNKQYKIDDTLSVIERSNTYKFYIEVVVMNTGSSSGNFISNIDFVDTTNFNINNKEIIYDTDQFGNTISIMSCDLIPTAKECNIKLRLSGIIIFEDIIDYDFTDENSNTHNLLLMSPSKQRARYGATDNIPVHCGAIVYYGDDNEETAEGNESIDYMPFTYATHTYDTSTTAKKKRRVMISYGIPTSRCYKANDYINIDNYPYKLDNYWLYYDQDNPYNINIKDLCRQYSYNYYRTIIINNKEIDSNYIVNINYDYNANKWSRNGENYILTQGNNILSVKYDNLFEDDTTIKSNPEVSVSNYSNKFIKDVIVSSNILNYGDRIFYNDIRFTSYTFGPLVMIYGIELFKNSLIEEIYFLNDALVTPIPCDSEETRYGYYDEKVYNYIPNDIHNYAIFYDSCFENTMEFKNNHFEIKLPYNTGLLCNNSFRKTGLNQIDFSNTYYIYEVGYAAIADNEYLNRRYIIDDNTGEEYRTADNKLVYEGEARINNNGEYEYNPEDINAFIDYDSNVVDKYLQPLNGYSFSKSLSLKFKHAQNAYITRLRAYAICNNNFIKTIDLGNTYAIGFQSLSDNKRLVNLLLPEVVYFGNFDIEATNSTKGIENEFSAFSITVNGEEYFVYYAVDTLIDSETKHSVRVIIDNKAYKVVLFPGYIWNKGWYSEGAKYDTATGKCYIKIVDLNDDDDSPNYMIGYVDTDFINPETIPNNPTPEQVEAHISLITPTENISSGYRNVEATITNMTKYSHSCINNPSLINIELGNKLYCISDENFLNSGKLRINNNHIYLIKENDMNNIIDIGAIIIDSGDFSFVNNNVKFIYNFYDPDKITVNWKLVSVETENTLYNDLMNITYHGTLTEFNNVKKKINWNARNLSDKYVNMSLVSERRVSSIYSTQSSLPNLHESDDGFTDHNYFALTIDDSELYFSKAENYIREIGSDTTYIRHPEYDFDIFPLKGFENVDPNATDDRSKLLQRTLYSYEHFEQLNQDAIAAKNSDDLNTRLLSNEYDYMRDLKDTFKDRYYGNDKFSADIYDKLKKNYFDDINIFKFKNTCLPINLTPDDEDSVLWQFEIKSRYRNININGTIKNIPSRNFIDGSQYFNDNVITFMNDDNTDYYVPTIKNRNYLNIFNELENDLIDDVVNNNNPIFKDSVLFSYGYGVSRYQNTSYLNRGYIVANMYDSNHRFEDLGDGRLRNTNNSSFENLIADENKQALMTPSVINFATTVQCPYIAGIYGNLGYAMFGEEVPRNRFNAENPSSLTLYNIECLYPKKNYDDNTDYSIAINSNAPKILLSNAIDQQSLPDEDQNDYTKKIRKIYDYCAEYTRYNQFKNIPDSTTNLTIYGENSSTNSYKNRFTFIYRVFDIIIENGSIIGYRINGWRDEKESGSDYKLFSSSTTVYSAQYYVDHSNLHNEEFTFNNHAYLLSDIFEDLNNYCTEIDGNNVKVSYSGGIREFTLS